MEIALQNSSYSLSDILNDRQLYLFEIINYVCLSMTISIFGIAGNSINIIIFFRQGFANTVNISFIGLAISDICCLIFLLWMGVWLNPYMGNSGVPFNTVDFQYLTGNCPHVAFGRTTGLITVYVTAERCLCIVFPLKIKQLVTPTRTVIILCSLCVINFCCLLPEFATSYFDWLFSKEQNRTILAIAYRDGRELIPIMFFLFIAIGIVSCIALVVFTVTLAVKLQQSSEWRKEATSDSDRQRSTSSKEKKTIKMIIVIALFVIVGYIPGTALSLTFYAEPEFYWHRRYHRLCLSLWSVAFVCNGFNSSINTVIYYTMSSNYRHTFHVIFNKSFQQK